MFEFRSVLIIEDNIGELESLINYLSDENIRYKHVTNPSDAIDELEFSKYDLIILDRRLQVMNDEASIEIINQINLRSLRFIPIFINSNFGLDDEYRKKIIRTGYPIALVEGMEKVKNVKFLETIEYINNWYQKTNQVKMAKTWVSAIEMAYNQYIKRLFNSYDKEGINLLSNNIFKEETKEKAINLVSDGIKKYLNKNEELKSLFEDCNTINSKELSLDVIDDKLESDSEISTGDILVFHFDNIKDLEGLYNSLGTSSVNLREIKEESCEFCLYGIVITGVCDYARPDSKLRNHKIILGLNLKEFTGTDDYDTNIRKITDLNKYQSDSHHLIPPIPTLDKENKTRVDETDKIQLETVVFDFQKIISISKSFTELDLKTIRACRLSENRTQHLISRYSNYANRLGVDELSDESIIEICQMYSN